MTKFVNAKFSVGGYVSKLYDENYEETFGKRVDPNACPACDGKGIRDGHECMECEGTGKKPWASRASSRS